MCNYLSEMKCGSAVVNPATTICCGGIVYVRTGVRPACCGKVGFDAKHRVCCNGKIVRKRNLRNAGWVDKGKPLDCLPERPVQKLSNASALPGQRCCMGGNGWKCCSSGEDCCSQVEDSSVRVLGFTTSCCRYMY